jgi:hypothetical protein
MREFIACKLPDQRREMLAALVAPAVAAIGAPKVSGPQRGDTQAAKPPAVLSMNLPRDFGEGLGLRREVEALEQSCQAARRLWQRLDEFGDDDGASVAMRKWLNLGAQLRQVAKDTPKVLRDTSENIPIADTKALLVRAISEFQATLRRSGSRLQDTFADRIDPHVFKAAIDREHDEAIAYLREVDLDAVAAE